MAAFCAQLFGPNDMDTVKKVQSGDKLQSLSAYLEQPAATVAPPHEFSTIQQGTRQDKLLSISTSPFSSHYLTELDAGRFR